MSGQKHKLTDHCKDGDGPPPPKRRQVLVQPPMIMPPTASEVKSNFDIFKKWNEKYYIFLNERIPTFHVDRRTELVTRASKYYLSCMRVDMLLACWTNAVGRGADLVRLSMMLFRPADDRGRGFESLDVYNRTLDFSGQDDCDLSEERHRNIAAFGNTRAASICWESLGNCMQLEVGPNSVRQIYQFGAAKLMLITFAECREMNRGGEIEPIELAKAWEHSVMRMGKVDWMMTKMEKSKFPAAFRQPIAAAKK
jgi:hypothetical protein